MAMEERRIRHLEALARIDLRPHERERLTHDLGRIVEFVEQLQSVETGTVEPTSGVVHQDRVTLRPDEPRPGLDRDVVLGQAPDSKNGYFRVPKVIER